MKGLSLKHVPIEMVRHETIKETFKKQGLYSNYRGQR